MKVISIDPSIHNLGIAVTDAQRKVISATLIRSPAPEAANWQCAALIMVDAVGLTITTAIDDEDPGDFIIVSEMPGNWFGARGEASKDSEAVQKLYYYVGYQMAALRRLFPLTRQCLVQPTTWKGQVPKNITQQRVLTLLKSQGKDLTRIDNNVADAIMIGQFTLTNYHRLMTLDSFISPIHIMDIVE